jgi:DNA-binding MarR family transcriptional regulator
MHPQLIPALHRATHRVGLYLDALRVQGLTQGEAHLLAHLAQVRAATVGELHEVLAHKRSTLTSILDRLVERGLVTRDVGEADRRTFVIELTAPGRRVAARTRDHVLDLERAVGRQFAAADLATFRAVLAAIERTADQRTGPGRTGARRVT